MFIYKVTAFNFLFVYQKHCSNIPASPGYGVHCISVSINRYFTAFGSHHDFLGRELQLTMKQQNQGFLVVFFNHYHDLGLTIKQYIWPRWRHIRFVCRWHNSLAAFLWHDLSSEHYNKSNTTHATGRISCWLFRYTFIGYFFRIKATFGSPLLPLAMYGVHCLSTLFVFTKVVFCRPLLVVLSLSFNNYIACGFFY